MTRLSSRSGCEPVRRFHSSTRRRLVRANLFLALLLSVGPAASAANHTLDEIKREYRASIAALDPIWTRCLFSKTYDVERAEIGHKNLRENPVEWAVDGEKFYFRWLGDNSTTWESYDGQSTWAVDYGSASKGEDPRQAKCVRRQRLATKTDTDFRGSVTPGWWLGMYFALGDTAQSGESVSTMLEKPSTKVVGSDDVDGHACVRVELVFRMLNNMEYPVTVWFEPAVGMLPRQITLDWPGLNAAVDFTVQQFQAVPHLGKTVHVPMKMVRRFTSEKSPSLNLTQIVELVDVKLGDAVPADLFKPELTKDVPVFDMDRKGQRIEWQNHLAGETPEKRAARLESMRLARSRPAAGIPEGLQPSTVAQPGGNWWPVGLFFLGIVLLAGATFFTRRS